MLGNNPISHLIEASGHLGRDPLRSKQVTDLLLGTAHVGCKFGLRSFDLDRQLYEGSDILFHTSKLVCWRSCVN